LPGDTIVTKRRQAIQQAMSLTEHTLRLRTICYRGLVIGVNLVAFVSFLWAVIQWSWLPLLGLLLLLPLTCAFLFVDCLMINRWRHRLYQMWVYGPLDVNSLCDVLFAIRVVPGQILQGMLSSLPTTKNLRITDDIDPLARRALAATVQIVNAYQSDRILLVSVAITTGLVSLVLAAVLPSWLPLFGLLFVVPIFGAGEGIQRFRLWRWRKKVSALRQDGLQGQDFVELAARFNWQPISEQKARLLDKFREGSAT
jgi:hypothetical protein